MKSKISIIIANYNNATYLPKCLDAILAQTFRDFEVIIIDDGSTDNSKAIISTYAAKDTRIRTRFLHKNSGQATARNIGLAMAKSNLIMFCDADDYYSPRMCEKMYSALSSSKANLVTCKIELIYEAMQSMVKNDKRHYTLKYSGLQTLNTKNINQIDLSPTNKIFRKDLLKKYQIKFPEGLKFEDAFFSLSYLYICKTVYFLNEPLYYYVRHDGSTMSKAWKNHSHTTDHLAIALRLYDFLQKHKLTEKWNTAFWPVFYDYELFALKYSRGKKRQSARNQAKKFIENNFENFKTSDKKTQTNIKHLTTSNFPLFIRRIKDIILKFIP